MFPLPASETPSIAISPRSGETCRVWFDPLLEGMPGKDCGPLGIKSPGRTGEGGGLGSSMTTLPRCILHCVLCIQQRLRQFYHQKGPWWSSAVQSWTGFLSCSCGDSACPAGEEGPLSLFYRWGNGDLGQKLAFLQMDASSLVSTVSVLPATASPAISGSIWDHGLATLSVGFWVLNSMVLVEQRG